MSDPNTDEICQPLNTIDSIINWKPTKESWASKVIIRKERSKICFQGTQGSCKSVIDSRNFLGLKKDLVPKTLYCHDMKGGYTEDKFANGCGDNDAFTFFRWSCIDIFVYFSHNVLTIPPLGWINAAHKNGVKVLGTIITEGRKGKLIWDHLLNNVPLLNNLAIQLASICKFYGFSGYLLNIENPIKASKMNEFVNFVKQLRSLLKEIDSENILIWYDSVIEPTGEVYYQNELNNFNSIYFENTDGIFLNYGWNDENLIFSKELSGTRSQDVYVGIDVFGRGCYGGGGFNSHLAMDKIRKYNLSAAIFAPGWVHENKAKEESFISRDYKFWNSLFTYFYLSGPSILPFSTTFSTGSGKKLFSNGKLVKESWHNLSKQECHVSDMVGWGADTNSCLSYYDEDAFDGGNSLLINCKHFESYTMYHIRNVSSPDPALGFLSYLTREELDSILNDDSKLEEIVKDHKQFKDIEREKELLLVSNRSLADFNLSKEPLLTALKTRLFEASENCGELYKSVEEKYSDIVDKSVVSSLDGKLSLLQSAATELEEDSEGIAEKFLNSELELEDFLEQFLSRRKIMHLNKVKADKMAEIISQQNQLNSAGGISYNPTPLAYPPMNANGMPRPY